MKYILMCGGVLTSWDKPRQLTEIKGEPIVERTIRLLRENGVDDIAISTHDPEFQYFGVPILWHQNDYTERGYDDFDGYWVDAFYLLDEPVCYLMGDVVFSSEAIKTIVETETDDIEFFASRPPFDERFSKVWAEPFALKVVNNEHLRESIRVCKIVQDAGITYRKPIMWELWQIIKRTPLNTIDYDNYTAINDYTCDIDEPEDIAKIERWIE